MTNLEQAIKNSLDVENELNRAKRELRRHPSMELRIDVRGLQSMFEKTLDLVEEARSAL
jgi:hypothetical protein